GRRPARAACARPGSWAACYHRAMFQKERRGRAAARVRRVCCACAIAVALAALARIASGEARDPFPLDQAAQRWVDATFGKLTLDEKIGQLIVPSLVSTFLSTDT